MECRKSSSDGRFTPKVIFQQDAIQSIALIKSICEVYKSIKIKPRRISELLNTSLSRNFSPKSRMQNLHPRFSTTQNRGLFRTPIRFQVLIPLQLLDFIRIRRDATSFGICGGGLLLLLSNPQSPLAYPCRQISSKSCYCSHTPQNLTDLFGSIATPER